MIWNRGLVNTSTGLVEESKLGLYTDIMSIPTGTQNIHMKWTPPVGHVWHWENVAGTGEEPDYKYVQKEEFDLTRQAVWIYLYVGTSVSDNTFLTYIVVSNGASSIDTDISLVSSEVRYTANYMRIACRSRYGEPMWSGAIPTEMDSSSLRVIEGMPTTQYDRSTWHENDSGIITADNLPSISKLIGSFSNATNLRKVSIPPTVKKIGRYSFRNTQLTSVIIARDCEYYDTSFPVGCTVNYYT